MPTLHLAQSPEADKLLAEDPLALLIGMVLDQQVPLERAFSAPADLRERLGGTLDAASLAEMDPDGLVELFRQRPALHRFPGSMAGRVQQVCRVITEEYGGEAGAIWEGVADGDELLARVQGASRLRRPEGADLRRLAGQAIRRPTSGMGGGIGPLRRAGSFRSVADIDSPEALAKVRQHKQAAKAAAKPGPPAPTGVDGPG